MSIGNIRGCAGLFTLAPQSPTTDDGLCVTIDRMIIFCSPIWAPKFPPARHLMSLPRSSSLPSLSSLSSLPRLRDILTYLRTTRRIGRLQRNSRILLEKRPSRSVHSIVFPCPLRVFIDLPRQKLLMHVDFDLPLSNMSHVQAGRCTLPCHQQSLM